MSAIQKLNDRVNNSAVGRYFHMAERNTNLITELRAGTVTFLAMAYIISVNANILSDTGGPCSQADCTNPGPACTLPGTLDAGYNTCVDEVRKNLITATIVSSMVSCLIMGVGGNMPIALAPGMGLNAYFTYNVVGVNGTGNVSYKTALTAIFIEGWIFIILSITGVRGKLISLLPKTLTLSMSAGIGLFLAFIGLQGGQGLGVVADDEATLVTLGGCPFDAQFSTQLQTDLTGSLPPLNSTAYYCNGQKMHSATMWLGISGFIIMCVLMSRGFKGAVIVGILFVTFIAWIPGHAASWLGTKSQLLGGVGGTGAARMAYFKKVVAVPNLSRTGAQLDFGGLKEGNAWLALITFLYVDFFDTTGTLFSMANFVGTYVPGFVNEKKQFPRQIYAYCSDGLGIVVGSLCGTSPVTCFIESATGIREGGRTGVTALASCGWFFVALWFTPLLASIPVYATGPALILVGALMMINVVKIDWADVNKAVPAFLTIAIMPFTYSIAYGVIAGVISYIIAQLCKLILDKLEAAFTGYFGKAKRTNYEGKDITLQPGANLAVLNDSAFNVCPDDVNPELAKTVPLPATLSEDVVQAHRMDIGDDLARAPQVPQEDFSRRL
ncbi:hypothetical protein WJX84_005524 [Apatococcus fuscideae]|uniref:Uncharacterized protein n=1 Tax=Apatococcus fuscideae TaxID=2026836 RepID=A0AAW1SMR4_9CHLO